MQTWPQTVSSLHLTQENSLAQPFALKGSPYHTGFENRQGLAGSEENTLGSTKSDSELYNVK